MAVQLKQYPRDADGRPMDVRVGVLTDASGNLGKRLVTPPTGPDGAPIDTFGLILVNSDGNIVDVISGSFGNTILNGARDPTFSDGIDGDFWINTASWFIFGPKVLNVWPAGVPISSGIPEVPPTPVGPGVVQAPSISLMGGSLAPGGVAMFHSGVYSGVPDPVESPPAWLRNGVVIAGESDIHYTFDVADVGANITARQTAQNASGTIQIDTNALGPIQAAAPDVGDITAPVLTQTSADGAVPFTWQATIDDTVAAGDIWRLQTAPDNTFAVLTNNLTKLVSPAEFEGGATSFAEWLSSSIPPPSGQFGTPNGSFAMRMYVERHVELVEGSPTTIQSPASNILEETITAASTVLTTTNGQYKNNLIIIPSNLSALPTRSWKGTSGVGANCGSRATNPTTGKKVIEIKVLQFDASTGGLTFGVCDSNVNFGSGSFPIPGAGSTKGASLRITSSFTHLAYNGSGSIDGGVGGGQVDDFYYIEFDTDTGDVKFFRRRAGVDAQVGGAIVLVGSLPAAGWYGFVGAYRDDHGEVNYGQSAPARTPTATYTMYDL